MTAHEHRTKLRAKIDRIVRPTLEAGDVLALERLALALDGARARITERLAQMKREVR